MPGSTMIGDILFTYERWSMTTATDFADVMRLYAKLTHGKIPKAEAQRAFERFSDLSAAGADIQTIAWDLVRRYPAIVGEKPLDNRERPLNPLDYYTIHAHNPGGGIFRLRSHVQGKDVQREKREIAALAEEGTRLRYEIIWEGASERLVGLAGNARVINAPDPKPTTVVPTRRSR